MDFHDWAGLVWNFGSALGSEVSLANFRKNIYLEFYNEAGQLVIAYKIYRCWVSEYQAMPDLDANANAIAIEHIKLENEGWERDTSVTEPVEPTLSQWPPDMRALTQADFLTLWESGRRLHPLDWGLLAIHTMFPATRRTSVADWSGPSQPGVGGDALACFGSPIRGWTSCGGVPKSSSSIRGRALVERPLRAGRSRSLQGQTFRPPTSRDLARIAAEDDPGKAAVALVEMCRINGEAGPVERSFTAEIDWTEEDLDAIGDKMALADPLGEIMLHFDCPECGELFDDSLDLPTFLRAEIEGRAKRLLREVHTLASAYGWGEAEILSLNPARRQFYSKWCSHDGISAAPSRQRRSTEPHAFTLSWDRFSLEHGRKCLRLLCCRTMG